MKDKNGVEIKAGDIIFNDNDRYDYYEVVNINGVLCLEDPMSPLARFQPEVFWEVRNTETAKRSVQTRREEEKS